MLLFGVQHHPLAEVKIWMNIEKVDISVCNAPAVYRIETSSLFI